MGKIYLLPDDVASQVAAGEVVERPASVVKELVENSIDAGATRITVEFSRGGGQLVRVVDDGSGMDREDALLCLERHATSKLRRAEDLARVETMGFRGEAIPSIASVSRFHLLTRPRDAATGTEMLVAGGKIESVAESGGPAGTSIEVRSLFFNLPARRKFLRGEETESAHIIHQMQSLALAHPGVAMSLIRDGRSVWQAAATGDLGVRVRDIFGPDLLARLLPLARSEENGITLSGFLARPGEGRPDREQQFVILNGRVVQCAAVFQSLREAYAEAMPRGWHPLAVLKISMNPAEFDCNVHPSKREIRFHRPDQLRQAVFLATQRLLEGLRGASRGVAAPAAPQPFDIPASRPVASGEAFTPAAQGELSVAAPPDGPGTGFRLLGGVGDRWIIMEGSEGIVLVDARAASERILFETLRREAAGGTAPAQHLLLPTVVELTAKDAAWIAQNVPALRASGFLLEPFGGTSFKVEALPACLADRDARAALLDICGLLSATGSPGAGQPASDALVRSVSRLAAMRSFPYDEVRARQLVRELLRCELPYACPQGHPTMIQWSFSELDRKFGRG